MLFIAIPARPGSSHLVVRPAQPIGCSMSQEGSPSALPLLHQAAAAPKVELFIYFTNSPIRYFPHLMFQTRYGAICFWSRCAPGDSAAASRPEGGRPRAAVYYAHLAVLASEKSWYPRTSSFTTTSCGSSRATANS